MDWYKRFKSGPNGHLLNIVFVSSDFDDSEFREYCQDMPGWYALDFKDREKEVYNYTTLYITPILAVYTTVSINIVSSMVIE